jgi:hypothetical protein
MRSWDADSPAGQEIAFVGEHLDGAPMVGVRGP